MHATNIRNMDGYLSWYYLMCVCVCVCIYRYCAIIRIRGGSSFVVFMGSPPQRIYILNKNKLR